MTKHRRPRWVPPRSEATQWRHLPNSSLLRPGPGEGVPRGTLAQAELWSQREPEEERSPHGLGRGRMESCGLSTPGAPAQHRSGGASPLPGTRKDDVFRAGTAKAAPGPRRQSPVSQLPGAEQSRPGVPGGAGAPRHEDPREGDCVSGVHLWIPVSTVRKMPGLCLQHPADTLVAQAQLPAPSGQRPPHRATLEERRATRATGENHTQAPLWLGSPINPCDPGEADQTSSWGWWREP